MATWTQNSSTKPIRLHLNHSFNKDLAMSSVSWEVCRAMLVPNVVSDGVQTRNLRETQPCIGRWSLGPVGPVQAMGRLFAVSPYQPCAQIL